MVRCRPFGPRPAPHKHHHMIGQQVPGAERSRSSSRLRHPSRARQMALKANTVPPRGRQLRRIDHHMPLTRPMAALTTHSALGKRRIQVLVLRPRNRPHPRLHGTAGTHSQSAALQASVRIPATIQKPFVPSSTKMATETRSHLQTPRSSAPPPPTRGTTPSRAHPSGTRPSPIHPRLLMLLENLKMARRTGLATGLRQNRQPIDPEHYNAAVTSISISAPAHNCDTPTPVLAGL